MASSTGNLTIADRYSMASRQGRETLRWFAANWRAVLRGAVVGTLPFVAVFVVASAVGALYVSALTASDIELIHLAPIGNSDEVLRWSAWTHGLAPFGLIFGAFATACFAVFRLGMGLWLALAAAFLVMTSPLNLENLVPSITRDYIKAPFVVVCFLLTAMLAAGRPRLPRIAPTVCALGFVLAYSYWFRGIEHLRVPAFLCFVVVVALLLPLLMTARPAFVRIATLGCAAGLTIGYGFWFRQDLAIFVVPFFATLAVFADGGVIHNLRAKLLAAILFALSVLPFALTANRTSTASPGHHALAGFLTASTQALHVVPSVYDWGYLFSDTYIQTMMKAQAAMTDPGSQTPDAERGGRDILKRIVWNFPADIITRALASSIRVANLPFAFALPPAGVERPAIRSFYAVRASLLGAMNGLGPLIVLAALLLLTIRNLRLGLFGLFVVSFFTAYPMLQFQGRHVFHLEFISLLSFGYLLETAVQMARGKLSWGQRPAIGVASFAGVLAALVAFVACARLYQSRHVETLLTDIAAAAREPLEIVASASPDNGSVLLNSPDLRGSGATDSLSYLAVSFSKQNCNAETIWPLARYKYDTLVDDYSRTLSVNLDPSGAPTVVLIPVYQSQKSRFIGIDLPQSQARCLTSVSRVRQPETLAFLPSAVLMPGWRSGPLYQRLSFEAPEHYSIPSRLADPSFANVMARSLTPLAKNDIAFTADIVRFDGDGISVSGRAKPGPQVDDYGGRAPGAADHELKQHSSIDMASMTVESDLLRTRPVPQTRGHFFVIEGDLLQGGFRLGLVSGGRTAGWIDITRPGHFHAAIKVQADGDYWVGLANNIDFYTSLENRFVIRRMGWTK